jgi:hypothetical protein
MGVRYRYRLATQWRASHILRSVFVLLLLSVATVLVLVRSEALHQIAASNNASDVICSNTIDNTEAVAVLACR